MLNDKTSISHFKKWTNIIIIIIINGPTLSDNNISLECCLHLCMDCFISGKPHMASKHRDSPSIRMKNLELLRRHRHDRNTESYVIQKGVPRNYGIFYHTQHNTNCMWFWAKIKVRVCPREFCIIFSLLFLSINSNLSYCTSKIKEIRFEY